MSDNRLSSFPRYCINTGGRFTGKLVLTELQVSHCWAWHSSTDLPISTGLRAREGWECRRGEGGKKLSGGGGGRMDEADLATVMEWGSECEGLVGEGVWGGGTIRRQAGVRRSVTSFFFPPAALCKELRFELNHTEEGKYTEREDFGKGKKNRKLTSQLFYSTLAQLLKHKFGNLWYFSYR